MFCGGGVKPMNEELLAVVNYMERERGLDRDLLFQTLESAILAAIRKNYGEAGEPRVVIDRKTCEIQAFTFKRVVERVTDRREEIALTEALRRRPKAEIGDLIEMEVPPNKLGRIAAQTAKQSIMQKIRQAERQIVFTEYKNRVGEVVTGTVRRFETRDIVVDLGRTEALLPFHERIPTEGYQVGDATRALILDVRDEPGAPAVILSRAHPDFVKRLFELEVSEIHDGTVDIKGVAREAGYRTKIAVMTHDERVDPVGACVGMRGNRVKNIVRELCNEKIDIVRWHEDITQFIGNALAPAKLMRIRIESEDERVVRVVADADNYSIAIGKRGENVRLSSKLSGWRIEVERSEEETSFEEKVSSAIEELARIDGIDEETAKKLVYAGFLGVAGILAADVNDIEQAASISAEEAQAIVASAVRACQAPPAPEENDGNNESS